MASFYHLCGKLEIDQQFSLSKRTVILTEKSQERRTTTNEKGEFCFDVKEGSYIVKPLITPEEREMGLRLLPQEKNV